MTEPCRGARLPSMAAQRRRRGVNLKKWFWDLKTNLNGRPSKSRATLATMRENSKHEKRDLELKQSHWAR